MMAGFPIVLSPNATPVTFVDNGPACEISENGRGTPVTPIDAGGSPLTLTGQPDPPPIDPVDLPYVFETNTLNGYSLDFTSETGAGFVRVVAQKTNASANLTATLDGSPWAPIAIAQDASATGVVVAIFSAKGESIGAHNVTFAGNVAKAAGRFGDVLTYTSIAQYVTNVISTQYFWENAIDGVGGLSDITMVAGSVVAAASPISGDGNQQGQSFVTPLSAWFSHSPPINSPDDYYVAYPSVPAGGVMASVEVVGLKPLLPDLQLPPSRVHDASFTQPGFDTYICTIYNDSSIRFQWPLGQLLNGQDYNLSFTVNSITGAAAADAVWDWCDGDDGAPGTVPPSVEALSAGAFSETVSSPGYTSTYRFLDIGNNRTDEDDWGAVVISITVPTLTAIT